jgi:alginate O-acetyltransferase complex protein AlgI
MLFSSTIFVFAFLPITLLVFMALARAPSRLPAVAWLAGCSVVFYAWSTLPHLAVLGGSIVGNYLFARILAARRTKALLVVGLGANLAVLCVFKYLDFFVHSVAAVAHLPAPDLALALPLAISFFTFQQIAYLVDVHGGRPPAPNFAYYALFVTFFPHLVAGPILHHADIIPQFQKTETFRFSRFNLLLGVAIFSVGLYKKVMLADGIALYVAPGFESVGAHPPLFLAWSGALAYALQIYFDFSGYSDMAIGLGRIFGVRLPLNFHSPYKAENIVSFWRRWHMTLSRFLRDYLYVPLGGNRKGRFRRYGNLMITMLLGGLWHGAAWTFVIWGGLHGLYLVVNHVWHGVRRRAFGWDGRSSTIVGRWLGRGLTLLAVVVAWVFFRAKDLGAALSVLHGMAGLNGVDTMSALGDTYLWIGILLAVVWLMPNTQQLFARWQPAFDYPRDGVPPLALATHWAVRPAMVTTLVVSVLVALAVLSGRGGVTGEFIYMIF